MRDTLGTGGSGLSSGFPGSTRLSPRQEQVVREIATGDTYAVIGDRLGISEGVVKNHAHAAMVAEGVHSMIGLYVKRGWLRVPE